jgi:D-xylose transport system substrate-binding protein
MANSKPVVARDEIDNGKVKVPSILYDVVVVTKSNLADTVVKDGFRSYDDIYAAIPEAQRPPRPVASAK